MTNMKVALLTQPHGSNYGGTIQAWALEKSLCEINCEVTLLDRRFGSPSFLRKMLSTLKKVLKKFFSKSSLTSAPNKMLPEHHLAPFLNSEIKISEPFYDSASLKAYIIKEKFDAIIVGSDQVWRPKYSPNIFNYFLSFTYRLKLRRISYAASFGVDNFEFNFFQKILCKFLIHKFNNVSVREDSGLKICQEQFSTNAFHALDPTLLLEPNKYDLIHDKDIVKLKKTNLLGIYFLDESQEKRLITKNASAALNAKIINAARSKIFDNHIELNSKDMSTIKEWLSCFRLSDFIITDSFHGVVFAIIFQKQFRVFLNKNRGKSRVLSLLKMLKIPSFVIVENQRNKINFHKKINYKKVKKEILLHRIKSKKFLKEALFSNKNFKK